MFAFKNILLTTDLSPYAEAAVPYAVALAKQSNGTIHLFHAFEVDAVDALESGVVIGASAWIASVRKRREEKLIAFARDLAAKSEVKVTYASALGSPATVALRYAREAKVDLVVTSTHGRTGIPHLFLGSVAEKILRQSPVPVLTVRPGICASSTPLAFNTLLVPTDFSANSEAAFPYAIEIAKLNGGKLLLAHVIEAAAYYPAIPPSYEIGEQAGMYMAYVENGRKKQLADVAAKLSAQTDLRVDTAMECGRADEQIAAIARQHKADLVVLSTHGYSGFAHFAFGSVAERIVRSSPIPVLSVRSPDAFQRRACYEGAAASLTSESGHSDKRRV